MLVALILYLFSMADISPVTVGGTRCRGVQTSSVSWRTYTMMRSVTGGIKRGRFALSEKRNLRYFYGNIRMQWSRFSLIIKSFNSLLIHKDVKDRKIAGECKKQIFLNVLKLLVYSIGLVHQKDNYEVQEGQNGCIKFQKNINV